MVASVVTEFVPVKPFLRQRRPDVAAKNFLMFSIDDMRTVSNWGHFAPLIRTPNMDPSPRWAPPSSGP